MNAADPERIPTGYKLHPHVMLVHFPISFFISAFTFQALHLFFSPACFEMATNVSLAIGTVVLIPTVWSGWRSWKRNYQGAVVMLFQRKIAIAFTLLGLGITLSVWRFATAALFTEDPGNLSHWAYVAGNTMLILGALAEGYYGGRLNHH
jgi:uncharacterized membrane protein